MVYIGVFLLVFYLYVLFNGRPGLDILKESNRISEKDGSEVTQEDLAYATKLAMKSIVMSFLFLIVLLLFYIFVIYMATVTTGVQLIVMATALGLLIIFDVTALLMKNRRKKLINKSKFSVGFILEALVTIGYIIYALFILLV